MRKSVLFRIGSDPVGRIWSGVNSIIIPADAVENDPGDVPLYLGGGALVNLPELEQVINGVASRVDVVLSGVDAETLRLAREEAATVKGATCHIGDIYFDDNWQIAEVEWIGVLRADYLTTSSSAKSRSITLSLSTEDTDRSRAPVAFWSDTDQRRRSPTDRFCDHVAGISAGTSRRFGPK
jgi:hypothetical protein